MSKRVVILTGAGISAESGLKTFRASDGLWEDHHIEDVATPEAYERNPALVQQFYNERRRRLLEVEPNQAHLALADFEAKFNQTDANDGQRDAFLLVTQNIDDLHERAGSKNLIHMHGELLKIRCDSCATVSIMTKDVSEDARCICGGSLRPHIVWFGEMPFAMARIYQALDACELFVSIGTSGNVYPAAGFVQAAKSAGARAVELNLDPSMGTSFFDEIHHGKATEIVPHFFTALLAQMRA